MAESSEAHQPNNGNDNNPSKYNNYYNHFLFKALIVTIFLVLLPFFPSQSPDSINQKTPHTRSWEILQLIFVGIAVSYGLFSKKSDEVDKEIQTTITTTKFDNAQSYVSRLLQVSSVFDDESDNPSLFDYSINNNNNNSSINNININNNNNNKVIQTWNNQYQRGEPVVVVETESPVLEEQRGITVKASRIGSEKPLLLPVRRLKSRIDAESDLVEETNGKSSSSSAAGSKRFSSKSMEDNTRKTEEEKNVVLPSPIPWRSRSGRMEIKEEFKLFSSNSSIEDPEFNKLEPKSFRSQSFRSSNSPVSPKIIEEIGRKKTPTPPPPPPPHFLAKSLSMKWSPTAKKNDEVTPGKELRRSVRSAPTEAINEDTEPIEKSVRTFTPFNGRGRLYGQGFSNGNAVYAKANENEGSFARKQGSDENKDEDSELEDNDEDYDFFDEEIGGNHNVGDMNGGDHNNSGDGGPDVDKKADEFIAKFREQIRLQRIESIRRTAGQPARNQLVR